MERWRGRKWEQPLSSKMSQQPFYQIQTKGNTWLALDQQCAWVCVRSYGSIYVQAFQICPYEYKHVYNGCCVDVYSKESCLCFTLTGYKSASSHVYMLCVSLSVDTCTCLHTSVCVRVCRQHRGSECEQVAAGEKWGSDKVFRGGSG